MSMRDSVALVPVKGPALTPLKKGILTDLIRDVCRFGEKSSIGTCILGNISFILREDCRCSDDSQFCMCGGGFSVSSHGH